MFSESRNDRNRRISDCQISANLLRDRDNAAGIFDNSAEIGDDATGTIDIATGIVDIATKVIPC